ncbi:MAG: hypothetical protein RRY12_06610 [Cloacibacillus sp.]
MKLRSLASFRRYRRLKKFLLVLAAAALGFMAAAEGRFSVMRISDIQVTPAHILPQYAVWGTLSPAQEAFWPSFWFAKNEYKGLIEAYYPVTVAPEICGWGKFSLTVAPLSPLYKIFWAGKFWYLAENGKVWPSSLAANTLLAAHNADKLPILSWSEERATPINLAGAPGNIFTSSLPLPLIKSWYSKTEQLGWNRSIKFIQAAIREGTPVVRIIFYTAGDENGAAMILPEDAKLWDEAAVAIKKLYGGIANLPPDLYIDCTYNGKILIKNVKPQSADISGNNVGAFSKKAVQ